MVQEFKVKPMFENQVHERLQFSLKFEGDTFQGIVKDREIMWFHPLPFVKHEKNVVRKMEGKINQLMTNENVTDSEPEIKKQEEFKMVQEFKVKPMFEDQVHERHQFTLKFKGDTFQGIMNDREIMWFHPLPNRKHEKTVVQNLEMKVIQLMTSKVKQIS